MPGELPVGLQDILHRRQPKLRAKRGQMIHCFTALDRRIALDVESGAVYALDELAYEAVRRWETLPREALGALLCASFEKEEVEETLREIDGLAGEGALFTEATPRFEPDPGIVKAMCLHMAHDCNLRCGYCFASQGEFGDGGRSLMPLDVGKKALFWLVEHSGNRKSLEVDFFGGEPLLNFPVVKEVVAYGRALERQYGKRFHFTLTTNALALTDDIICFLNDEMENVVLSIDGRKEVHDAMRPMPNGKGSFERVLPHAKKLAISRGQRRYYVRGTFTRNNLDFDRDALFLAGEGFEQISIEPVVADVSCSYALSEDDLPAICASYDRLAREYVKRRKEGRWFNFFHFMVDFQNGPCLKKRLKGCGAGNEYVAVTPQGDLYPCHQFVGREGFKMGSVLDGAFDRPMQKDFANNHVLSKESCASCWAKYYCSGGCAANAHFKNGDIGKPYELECRMERKRLELAIAVAAMEME